MKVYVYTREVDKDSYPDGLARSVHMACGTKSSADSGEERQALNRNYGILFAKGEITEKNTILPLGVKNPKIFVMEDGVIGISAERVYESGDTDERTIGKVLLWKTHDLINFSDEEMIQAEDIEKFAPSDSLDVDSEIVERACRYWNPIVCTGVSVPEKVVIETETGACDEGAEQKSGGTKAGTAEQQLDSVKAVVSYSDGSGREKKVCWDKSGLNFNVPGEYRVSGKVSQQRFKFPLAKGYGDPVIFPWEGKWYFISTNDNLNDIGIYVREADEVEGLFADGVEQHLILPFDPERGFEQTFWAPEFHVIGGELYILFAVSGHVWGPQCHMMKKKKGASIIDADSWEDPIRVCRMDGSYLAEKEGSITLDMTYIKAESGSYVIWSYREKMGTEYDTGSMLYIASIDEKEPWKLTSEPVLLTRPLYGWENVSGTINNEGPYAFLKDGKVYVTYSGGAANGYTYVLGLFTADEDKNLLDMSNWTKSKTSVLNFYSVKGEYGPGHNSFFTNEDGEMMIAYHGETELHSNLRCDGIRRVHFRANGTPYFQMSADEDLQDTEVSMRVVVK